MCRKIFVLFIHSLPLLIKQIGPNLITPDFARSARVSETTPASGNRRDRWRPPCTHCVSQWRQYKKCTYTKHNLQMFKKWNYTKVARWTRLHSQSDKKRYLYFRYSNYDTKIKQYNGGLVALIVSVRAIYFGSKFCLVHQTARYWKHVSETRQNLS